MHPFRFAVQLSSAPTGKAWRELSRKVEALGYSTLFIPDHFGDQWAPIVALTVAAEATESLKVGSLVFDNDYRHPVVLAKEIATLDLVTEGRVEFGLGAGWMKSDYEQSGMPYDRPGVRIERMQEGLTIMKSLWEDGTVTLPGKHYSVSGAEGLPRPYSSPRPPILLGGGSPRVLSVAAKEADIVGINPSLAAGAITADVADAAKAAPFRQRVKWVKEAAGSRFSQLELQCLTFMVQIVPNAPEVLESVAPLFGITPEEAAEMPIVLVGTVEEIADTLRQRRQEYGFSYWVVHEAELEAFAPVVDLLTGT